MTHVIITGGSSGIGLAVARLHAARGARVSLIARTESQLQTARDNILETNAIDGSDVHAVAADVGIEAELAAAIRRCVATFGPCDVLVASAGIVEPATFDTLSSASFERQMRVNFLGSVHAVRCVYADMKQRGSGQIMLVSSGAGLIGIYGYAAYCASKFALHGFAEAMRSEARPHGVRISICFPPDTQTPQLEGEIALRPPEAAVTMGRVRPWTAQAVASRIVKAMDRGQFEVFFGFSLLALGRFGSLLKPLLNRWFDREIARETARRRP